MSTLFIYGSFSEGMVHYNKISDFIESCRAGAIKGSAYRLDVGFPVVVSEGESTISGTVVTLKNSEVLFPLLDEFHGFSSANPTKSLYLRQEVSVTCEGEVITAFAYVMNPTKLPRTATHISDGDWQKSIQERAPLTESLTRNQKVYVQKLGKSSGRDIVPINLDLYRELMNKGLIVDKGRRLALSPLGQEVFRFLGEVI